MSSNEDCENEINRQNNQSDDVPKFGPLESTTENQPHIGSNEFVENSDSLDLNVKLEVPTVMLYEAQFGVANPMSIPDEPSLLPHASAIHAIEMMDSQVGNTSPTLDGSLCQHLAEADSGNDNEGLAPAELPTTSGATASMVPGIDDFVGEASPHWLVTQRNQIPDSETLLNDFGIQVKTNKPQHKGKNFDVFKCRICLDKRPASKVHFVRHARDVHCGRKYKCHVCYRVYGNRQHTREHLMRKHSIPRYDVKNFISVFYPNFEKG